MRSPTRIAASGTPARARRRARASVAAALALLLLLVLAGCGTSHTSSTRGAEPAGDPYVSEPFTHQQKLVALGAQLVVSEGCSACHLIGSANVRAPGFATFAGHHVTLVGGHRALVDERFLRNGLLHPESVTIKGYDAGPMIRALARLHLAEHPARVAALAAFIEEIGPEPG